MGGDSSAHHKNPERKACVICKGLFATAWLLSRVRHGLRGTLVLRLKKAESAAAHPEVHERSFIFPRPVPCLLRRWGSTPQWAYLWALTCLTLRKVRQPQPPLCLERRAMILTRRVWCACRLRSSSRRCSTRRLGSARSTRRLYSVTGLRHSSCPSRPLARQLRFGRRTRGLELSLARPCLPPPPPPSPAVTLACRHRLSPPPSSSGAPTGAGTSAPTNRRPQPATAASSACRRASRAAAASPVRLAAVLTVREARQSGLGARAGNAHPSLSSCARCRATAVVSA